MRTVPSLRKNSACERVHEGQPNGGKQNWIKLIIDLDFENWLMK